MGNIVEMGDFESKFFFYKHSDQRLKAAQVTIELQSKVHRIIIPINHSSHWMVLYVDFQRKVISFLDAILVLSKNLSSETLSM